MQTEAVMTRSKKQAFTIVELLISVAIIAILVAVTVFAYNGIRERAIEASMQSDLENARTAIAVIKAGKKNYPDTADAANNGQGLKTSGNNELMYGATGGEYCVAATNPATSKTLRLLTGTIEEGSCGGVVTTFAGTPDYSSVVDGTGTAASFGWPTSAALDNDGNIIIGDCGSAVRKVTPGAVVTTVAGSNDEYAYLDGNGPNARFGCIRGVGVASSGVIYATQSAYNQFTGIRKIDTNNDVTSLAGSATRGNADGTGSAAQFQAPYGVVVNEAGDLYVADGGSNDRIRKITPAGVVTTFAGSTTGFADGNGTAAQFSEPHGIVFDSSGNLLVADSGNRRIRKITPSGDVTTLAGSGTVGTVDGTGTAAQFGYPTGLAIDANDTLYVTDNDPYSIRKVTKDGVVTTIAGTGDYGFVNGIGIYSQFGWMDNGIVIDSAGDLFIVDGDNYLIRKIDL